VRRGVKVRQFKEREEIMCIIRMLTFPQAVGVLLEDVDSLVLEQWKMCVRLWDVVLKNLRDLI